MLIGIDIGGTKTRFKAVVGDEVAHEMVVLSSEWRRGSAIEEPSNVDRLLDVLARVPGSSRAAVVVGAHGLDSAWQIAAFEERFAAGHGGSIAAVNDVELLAPAAGLDVAIALIAGTGSNVVGHDEGGAVITAGGHGYVLGDPGSAAALTREAVRAVLTAGDDGSTIDPLGTRLMASLGVDDPTALALAFVDQMSLTTWAAMAPLIFGAADDGSDLATAVIHDAAAALAADVARVHRRGALGTDVVCAGGVVTNQPRLFDALSQSIDDLGLGLSARLLAVEPVDGAVALARRLHLEGPASPQSHTRRTA